ncbi:hypothetical protein EYF80_039236 [Liparis tanakae]|uniref:Uncharacterized protein n=1 Tax=Liparis tanakae TaxID=230148 RepID=A0A4Z2GAG8_9TELE|nr:hypothetical protein EYF80_039236 [Liparis tanakae]
MTTVTDKGFLEETFKIRAGAGLLRQPYQYFRVWSVCLSGNLTKCKLMINRGETLQVSPVEQPPSSPSSPFSGRFRLHTALQAGGNEPAGMRVLAMAEPRGLMKRCLQLV